RVLLLRLISIYVISNKAKTRQCTSLISSQWLMCLASRLAVAKKVYKDYMKDLSLLIFSVSANPKIPK
ncbi:MAG: hypothetical protein WB511_14760, partial [Nitrososphaeraceae archaeon]